MLTHGFNSSFFNGLLKASLIVTLISFSTTGFARDSIEIASSNDFDAPEIEHNLETDVGRDSQGNVVIKAKVTDEYSINNVSMFFRDSGSNKYRKRDMISDNDSDKDTYIATIPKSALSSDRIEYYFEADDMVGNKKLKGLEFSPLKRSITDLSIVKSNNVEIADAGKENKKTDSSINTDNGIKKTHGNTFDAPIVWIPGL